MTSAVRVFESENFGNMRVVMRDDDPWFVAPDVCKALKFSNVSEALDCLDDDERAIISIGTPYGRQNTTVISEIGLYSLILISPKREAKKFKHWLTHKILPTCSRSIEFKLTPEDVINRVANIAKMIQKEFSVQKNVALAQAIDLVESFYGKKLEPLKKTTAQAVLTTSGLQDRQWRLTMDGANCGEVIEFLVGGEVIK